MVAERVVRGRDSEDLTVIESLDTFFESGDLRSWAQMLAGELLAAIEMARSRKAPEEGGEGVSALSAYLDFRQETFDLHPGLYSEFMEGIKNHLRQKFR